MNQIQLAHEKFKNQIKVAFDKVKNEVAKLQAANDHEQDKQINTLR